MSPTITTVFLILTSPLCAEVIDPPTETVNYCMPKSETDLSLEGFQLQRCLESHECLGSTEVHAMPTDNPVTSSGSGNGQKAVYLFLWLVQLGA